MHSTLHERDMHGRPGLRDEWTLRAEALHGRLHLRNWDALCADEVRSRRARMCRGELLERRLQVRAGLPMRAVALCGCSWLHRHFMYRGLRLSGEFRLQPGVDSAPSL